ncbi:hypothetical protein RI129_007150 [Pyrocoelia pectoralis]|uniref:MADF domain-containing protein n=1 Tax=Pyrocoelia pectoralis TaxID=417401 RepID=A0AAN7V7I3_9COLE
MNDEMLIEQVRQYEELYNMAHKKYSDNIHKDKIWRNIGSELKEPGPACKNRWISLRDQLRKAIKKNITKSGQASEKRKKWKYEDCMSFIIPFFKERETQSNIAEPGSSNEESNDEVADVIEHSSDAAESAAEQIGEVPKKFPKQSSKSPKKNSVKRSSKTKKLNHTETASSVLMQYLVESDKQETKESSDHPIDIFFKGLAATVKTFSPEFQHMAKSKLFNDVSEIEWRYLQSQNSNLHVPAPMHFPIPDYRTNTAAIPYIHTQQGVNKIYNPLRGPSTLPSASRDASMYDQTPLPSPVSSDRSSTQSYYENFQPENY